MPKYQTIQLQLDFFRAELRRIKKETAALLSLGGDRRELSREDEVRLSNLARRYDVTKQSISALVAKGKPAVRGPSGRKLIFNRSSRADWPI
jgi:hypothetical protein